MFRDALPTHAHVLIDHYRIHWRLPNLTHPKTFSEKIAWRMLYDRDARIPAMVDKIAAKQQMAARFGERFVIPTLAVYDNAAEIDFALLPYPCVIKPNHASGFNVFLREKPPGERKVRRRLLDLLRYRHQHSAEEWAYSQIAPRLLVEPFVAEPFIDGRPHGLTDYKFHTFGGRVFAVQVDVGRYTRHTRNFYTPEWEPMNFSLLYPRASGEIPKPAALDEMIARAGRIGEGFSYVRVDLYEIEGKSKFGEVTFYPGAGLEVFKPKQFDALFGEQWNL